MANNLSPEEAKLAEKQMLKYLMQVALTQPHKPIALLTCTKAVKAAKLCRSALRKTNKVFKRMKAETLKKTPQEQREMIITNFNKVITYYKEEMRMLTDVIREFRCYAFWNGHTLATLLGMPRSQNEMTDYRKIPITWF